MVFGCEGDRELKLAGYGHSCGDPSESFYFNLINIADEAQDTNRPSYHCIFIAGLLFAMFVPIVLLTQSLNNQGRK
jgi:hypothetical protein